MPEDSLKFLGRHIRAERVRCNLTQQKLRREYIAAVKMNLRTQLDNIDVQEKDGTIVNLGERYGSKRKH